MYNLMMMDTDSLYIAFARDPIDDFVKPELSGKWASEKWKWFSSENKKSEIVFEGNTITFAQWDKRQPGKFKADYVAAGMICLNSKVCHIWGGVDKEGKPSPKTSCKCTQKRRNFLLKDRFLNDLKTQKPHNVENAEFIKDNRGIIITYTQKKTGILMLSIKSSIFKWVSIHRFFSFLA